MAFTEREGRGELRTVDIVGVDVVLLEWSSEERGIRARLLGKWRGILFRDRSVRPIRLAVSLCHSMPIGLTYMMRMRTKQRDEARNAN